MVLTNLAKQKSLNFPDRNHPFQTTKTSKHDITNQLKSESDSVLAGLHYLSLIMNENVGGLPRFHLIYLQK